MRNKTKLVALQGFEIDNLRWLLTNRFKIEKLLGKVELFGVDGVRIGEKTQEQKEIVVKIGEKEENEGIKVRKIL